MGEPILPRWAKSLNTLIVGIHKLGIRMGPLSVLTVPGRITGEPRRTPMTPFSWEGQMYVTAFPGVEWARNARAAGTGTLTRGRKSRRVTIVELTPEQARPVLRLVPRSVPVGAAFLKRAGLIGEVTPDAVEALAGRCTVFRLEPLPADQHR